MNAFLNKFMMYFEIKRMHQEGYSLSKISNHLGINRRTVTKYFQMDMAEFESFIKERSVRQMVLSPYEEFVRSRLELYRDTSAAQMHDWLKEKHEDFPVVDPKTIFNFVKWVRKKHNLPFEVVRRDFESVEETSYGLQAQVDFGEYNMRTTDGKRVKVHFFTFILSRSRFKYVWFIPSSFTSETAVQAHEKAFEFCGGVPEEIVYDQDKVFITNENKGDIIFTSIFNKYVKQSTFRTHFCRKSDPQSKGKIENFVKYVKQNFLYNRQFSGIKSLNDEAIKWLKRTANKLPHGFTKKSPAEELLIELPYLKPHCPVFVPPPESLLYSVRIDNTISWKGNLYSVPRGTHKGRGSQVRIQANHEKLIITDPENNEICTHKIVSGSGQKIINANHKREKYVGLEHQITSLSALVNSADLLLELIAKIKKSKPRYLRDQVLVLKEVIEGNPIKTINKALDISVSKNIDSAIDFKDIVSKMQIKEQEESYSSLEMNPLSGVCPPEALSEPQRSRISDYQNLFN